MTEQTIYPTGFKRISWGAIFAGTIVALMVSLLLGLAGVAIGAATINPTTEANPMAGLGIGALIWWFVVTLVSLFAGGWVAGRLAGVPRRTDAMLHGVITWGVVTLVALFLIGSAIGGLLSGTTNLLASGISAATQGLQGGTQMMESAGARDQAGVLQNAKQEAKELLRQTGQQELQPQELQEEAQEARETATDAAAKAAQNPQQAQAILDRTLDKLYQQARDIISEADRQAAINIITARTDKSEQEAAKIVDAWIAQFQQAQAELEQAGAELQQEAAQAGEAVAEGTAAAAFWALLALVLGAVAAGFGGTVGMLRDRDVVIRTQA